MIIGIGCDLIDSRRIEDLYKKSGKNFLKRILSEEENLYFNNLPKENGKAILYLAKRFAAKEAVAKALGTGIGNIAFKDIAILNDENGKPVASFSNTAMDFLGNDIKINISLSDEPPMVLAFAVISR